MVHGLICAYSQFCHPCLGGISNDSYTSNHGSNLSIFYRYHMDTISIPYRYHMHRVCIPYPTNTSSPRQVTIKPDKTDASVILGEVDKPLLESTGGVQ